MILYCKDSLGCINNNNIELINKSSYNVPIYRSIVSYNKYIKMPRYSAYQQK